MDTAARFLTLAILLVACTGSEDAPADPYDLFADEPCAAELSLDLNGDGSIDIGWCRYDCGGPSDSDACPDPLAGETECTDVGGTYACAVRCDPGSADPCADGAECLNVSADNYVCTYVSG